MVEIQKEVVKKG